MPQSLRRRRRALLRDLPAEPRIAPCRALCDAQLEVMFQSLLLLFTRQSLARNVVGEYRTVALKTRLEKPERFEKIRKDTIYCTLHDSMKHLKFEVPRQVQACPGEQF